MAGPRPQPIILTEGQKQMLLQLARRATSTQRLARRARIVLAAAEGYNNEQIATELRINRETARLWRGVWLDAKAAEHLGAVEEVGRFLKGGGPKTPPHALLDEQRAGQRAGGL
jgi:hypothetical protein